MKCSPYLERPTRSLSEVERERAIRDLTSPRRIDAFRALWGEAKGMKVDEEIGEENRS